MTHALLEQLASGAVRSGPLVMGVVNVTPDSFSDGGQWVEPEAAIAHARELVAAGADIIDVGGESTRPGAERPSAEEEMRRVVPLVTALAEDGIVVSIDTMRADVAAAGLAAGGAIINDVSGGLADPQMPALVAESGAPFVVMHWRGHAHDMQSRASYDDVVTEVCRELLERVDVLLAAGATREQLVLDPGIGFAKTAAHNWELLAGLEQVVDLGYPVLLGTSRKGFLGSVGRREGAERPLDSRAVVTAATSARAARAGVWCVRVHDVTATVDAIDVAAALGEVRRGESGFEASAADGLAPQPSSDRGGERA
ncbi:MAG: dihydropteroate synthase [Janibacter sp.]